MVRIHRTWQACSKAAGVRTGLREEELYDLVDFPLFDPYQMGQLDTAEYLRELASYLSVSDQDARRVHDAILREAYPGTEQLVRDLKAAGIATACLSNTNTLHWEALNSDRYPAIRDLDFKVVSHTVRLLKPSPALLRLFDKDTQRMPRQIVFFDDHQGNIDAALEHGWNAIFVDHESDPASEMRQALRRADLLTA